MINYNSPADAGESAKRECKFAVRVVVVAGQRPASENDGRIGSENRDLQV